MARRYPLADWKVRKKILDNVLKNPLTGCWIWQKSRYRNGYGQITYEGRKDLIHRVAYRLFIGEIPEGMCILHKCDNRHCINPEHFFVGTNADNQEDMRLKGRSQKAKGEAHGSALLTEDQVKEIRWLRDEGFKLKELMSKFGLKYGVVQNICQRRTWKHI